MLSDVKFVHLVFAFSLSFRSLCRHLVPQFGFFSQTHLLSLQPPPVLRGEMKESTIKD